MVNQLHKKWSIYFNNGAHALIEHNDGIGRQFCEDDIDDILRQRARTRDVEGAKTSTWLNKQGLVVSKLKCRRRSRPRRPFILAKGHSRFCYYNASNEPVIRDDRGV